MGVAWQLQHMKLKHAKISSVGFLARYTKICTNENFPLYGSCTIRQHLDMVYPLQGNIEYIALAVALTYVIGGVCMLCVIHDLRYKRKP